eukprot:353880-Chlamydomonas_euryale.AAC.11
MSGQPAIWHAEPESESDMACCQRRESSRERIPRGMPVLSATRRRGSQRAGRCQKGNATVCGPANPIWHADHTESESESELQGCRLHLSALMQ